MLVWVCLLARVLFPLERCFFSVVVGMQWWGSQWVKFFESLSQSLSVYPPIKLLISELFILPVGPGCSELRSDPLVHSLIAGGGKEAVGTGKRNCHCSRGANADTNSTHLYKCCWKSSRAVATSCLVSSAVSWLAVDGPELANELMKARNCDSQAGRITQVLNDWSPGKQRTPLWFGSNRGCVAIFASVG